MSRRMFCVSFLLLVIGLLSAMTFSVNGQKASANTESSNANVKDEFVQKYKDISALTAPERKAFFKNASAKDRSNLWKTHLALYFVKNPNLNNEQKDLVLEAISVSTPELFEMSADNSSKEITLQSLAQRAFGVFTKTEAAEIFANLGGGAAEINLLQKYQDISAVSTLKRKSLFRNASAKDRSDLWRVHLALILAKQSELSNGQREFLQEIISFATPELYQLLEDNSQTRAKVKSSIEWLLARALTLFSKQEAAEFFTKLGGKDEQSNSVSSFIDEVPIDIGPNTPDCGCHRGFGDMCSNGCVGTNCRTSSWGCGFLYALSCTGTECCPD
jgi:hypothetical protein